MQITIYTTPTCGYCNMAKQYFRSLNISFTEKDVSKNPKYAEEMVRKSNQMGVPVIVMGNEVIVGFDKNRINKILSH